MEREVKFTFDESPSMENFNKKFSEILALTAPAGYGLGENHAATHNDIDAITITGWYVVNGAKLPAELAPYQGNSLLRHEAFDEYHAVQTLYPQGETTGAGNRATKAIRVKEGGVWYPWEWVNPPMYPDKEYRTTRRFMGKPVYVKAVDFGALPNATAKNVAHGVANIQYVIDNGGARSDGSNIPCDFGTLTNTDASKIDLGVGRNDIVITTNVWSEGLTATVWMAYTKTTD